jgi:hypothetical protein
MRIAMHQPYLFPYKGYFELIASVDNFVLYDDAKYMKGKYINRNYFPNLFTFRLKKHSDYAKINELRFFDVEEDKERFLRKTGLKAEKYLRLLKQNVSVSFNIFRVTREICDDLGINTPIYFSSEIPHGKFVDGVLDIVRHFKGDTYVNLPGGKEIYNQDQFGNIKLEFLETNPSPSILTEICET